MVKGSKSSDTLDIGGLFRGTATITLVVEIIAAIMMLGSGAAYLLSRGTFIDDLNIDVAIISFMIGSVITLFLFIGAIGFFVRINRRIQEAVIAKGIGKVDINSPRVKTVLILYGLAVGLLLIIGMYTYWIIWRTYFASIAETSLFFWIFSVSLGLFVLSFLIQIVVMALGRTTTKVIDSVLLD